MTFSIGAAQIQDALPAIPGRRVLELVDAQPGWLMEANGVLHPRGSEYQTLFVIDGVPMDENRSPAFAPDLQEGELQGMGVLTGNFPAEYGRKLGGVIEVTTARDIERGLHLLIDAGGGSFDTASAGASVRYGWTRQALSVSGSGARTDRYLDPPTEDNFTNEGSLRGIGAAYDEQATDADRSASPGTRARPPSWCPTNGCRKPRAAAGSHRPRTAGAGYMDAAAGRAVVLNARGMAADAAVDPTQLLITLEHAPEPEHELILQVARRMIETQGSALGDIRTGAAGDARYLRSYSYGATPLSMTPRCAARYLTRSTSF